VWAAGRVDRQVRLGKFENAGSVIIPHHRVAENDARVFDSARVQFEILGLSIMTESYIKLPFSPPPTMRYSISASQLQNSNYHTLISNLPK